MIGHLKIVEINVKFLNGFIHVFVKCSPVVRCLKISESQTDRQLSPTSPGRVIYLPVSVQ